MDILQGNDWRVHQNVSLGDSTSDDQKMNKHVIKLSKLNQKNQPVDHQSSKPIVFCISDTELSDAKDKLSKADSSSSDTDEDTPHKRKKPITHADKPSEEVTPTIVLHQFHQLYS